MPRNPTFAFAVEKDYCFEHHVHISLSHVWSTRYEALFYLMRLHGIALHRHGLPAKQGTTAYF
jgi:hypothetical protein